MAKKHKNQESGIENYYDLKIDKVDELVAALKDSGESETEEPVNFDVDFVTGDTSPKNYKRNGKSRTFDPYAVDKLSRVPTWIKAIFIKWWFAGAVCYFVLMGLGVYLSQDNSLDAMVLSGFVLGILTDLMVNPIFRMIESDRHEFNNYTMFPFPMKCFWTFFANMLYYLGVMIVVMYAYTGLNLMINAIAHTDNVVHVGVEPLLYGIICVAVDMAFIGLKDGAVALIRLIKNRKKEKPLNV